MSNFLKNIWTNETRENKGFIAVGLLSIPFGFGMVLWAIDYTQAKREAELAPLPLISLETPFNNKTYRDFCKGYPEGFMMKVKAPDQTLAKIQCPKPPSQ